MPRSAHKLFHQPQIFTSFSNLIAAQSTRHGGVSPAPYQSLNLGLFTNDESSNVQENRRRFFSSLDVEEYQVAGSFQVHQDQVKVVEVPGQWDGFDALITRQKEVFLTVTIADCVPVLLYDPVQQAVAAIHAGWRGTVAQVVVKTLREMERQYQTKPANCLAFIGTCIDGDHYEVGLEVAEHFSALQKKWRPDRQKFYVDLKKANLDQLQSQGVQPKNIETSPYCTVADNDTFFSHRKEKGTTGRMLAVIGMKK